MWRDQCSHLGSIARARVPKVVCLEESCANPEASVSMDVCRAGSMMQRTGADVTASLSLVKARWWLWSQEKVAKLWSRSWRDLVS